MRTLPDNIHWWCGACGKHLETNQGHEEHRPLRRVGLGGDGLFWLVFGEYGTWKTRFAGTFPSPLRIEDFDLGTLSIQQEILKLGPRCKVQHYDPEDPETFEAAEKSILSFDPRWRSLIIDSASGLERACASKAKAVSGHELMELSDWNPAGERFGKLMRVLQWYSLAFGCQILVTAHEELDREYTKGAYVAGPGGKLQAAEPTSIKGLPDLTGKWARRAGRLPDVILRSRVLNGAPTLVAIRETVGGGGAYWEVKDRTGTLESLAPTTWGGGQGRPWNYGAGYCPPFWPYLWQEITTRRKELQVANPTSVSVHHP